MTNIMLTAPTFATESVDPPHPINTFTIATHVISKTLSNSHYKIIGSCTWATGHYPPKFITTLAIEQFLPDLIITVSNAPNTNPWIEAALMFENQAAIAMYQKTFQLATGSTLGFGDDSSQINSMHINDERTRVVNVIGSPVGFYRLPQLSHRAETQFGTPYYLSEADAVADRTEVAELVFMATHPNLLFNHEIGNNMHSWGHEIPRLMRVTQPSRFRASVVAAMHAVDIVTNKNALHVTQSTSNSCGKNCTVANAIYDPDQTNLIWQEVYPKNRNILPGDANDYGIEDDKAGRGNYIFVLWRKYRGCIQHDGKLVSALSFPKVKKPQKR